MSVGVLLSDDDRLAVLAAVNAAAGDGYAEEAAIRARLASTRLPGELLSRGLKRLHREGLVVASFRGAWRVTADGWTTIVFGGPGRDAVIA